MFKKTIFSIIAILMSLASYCHQNGLHFNSHSFAPAKRTTLLLNNGESIEMSKQFGVSFLMDLRDEPPFGNILCVKTDDGHHVDAMFSVSGKTSSYPTLAIDGKLHHINYNVTTGSNIPVTLHFDRESNTILLRYGNNETKVKADLSNCRNAVVSFGMHTDESNYYDVAPVNVRDVAVSNKGKVRYYWSLSKHEGEMSTDSIAGKKARAINPHWIYDTHVEWKQLLSYQSAENLQVAYNEADNLFYIVDKKKVRTFDPNTKKTTSIDVKSGRRIIDTANFLIYDAIDGSLFNYGTENPLSSRFNYTTAEWSYNGSEIVEPTHSNHAWTRANDSISYAFGGYGFYRYRDNLYRINQHTGTITEVDYSPRVAPRTGCAAAIVDGKMYIFGGFGNKEGKQELPGEYYYDLVSIDLTTHKSTTVWEGKGEQQTSFQLASEMYFDRQKNVFYAATSNEGGRIIRISLDQPRWEFVTGEMKARFEFKEMAFNLYRNQQANKLYIVINKIRNDNVHNVIISSIDLPLQDDYVPDYLLAQESSNNVLVFVMVFVMVFVFVIVFVFVFVFVRKTKASKHRIIENHNENENENENENKNATVPEDPSSANDEENEDEKNSANSVNSCKKDEYENDEEDENENSKPALKPSQITLLGKFSVTDTQGNDITSSFSKRLRDLLLIIILYTQKNSKGIEMREIDDNLWQNMSEISARNNRNVNISKLRMLLEKVGAVEIINDKIYYQIRLGSNVSCDYVRTMHYIARINDGYKDEKTIARTLELLLRGPLVPNVSYEWLDPFKAQYSESAMALLSSLLYRAERDGNDSLALKITETIMQHDPFNDKALSVICNIHCRNNRTGIAKKIYDNFCKVYESSMGEPYGRSFMEVCK